MSPHVCQPGRCPEQRLVEAAKLVLLAVDSDGEDVRARCQPLIELVQSARADALRAGPSWAEGARVTLWSTLGQCMSGQIEGGELDDSSRAALAVGLEQFERRQATGALVHPPCAEPGINWFWSVLDREPGLASRTITRALAAVAGPADMRQMGICQALGLALSVEAVQWTWPVDQHQAFQARLITLLLRPLAEEFAGEAAGSWSPGRAVNIEQRVKTLRDLQRSFALASVKEATP